MGLTVGFPPGTSSHLVTDMMMATKAKAVGVAALHMPSIGEPGDISMFERTDFQASRLSANPEFSADKALIRFKPKSSVTEIACFTAVMAGYFYFPVITVIPPLMMLFFIAGHLVVRFLRHYRMRTLIRKIHNRSWITRMREVIVTARMKNIALPDELLSASERISSTDFIHSQRFSSYEDCLQMVKLTCELERYVIYGYNRPVTFSGEDSELIGRITDAGHGGRNSVKKLPAD